MVGAGYVALECAGFMNGLHQVCTDNSSHLSLDLSLEVFITTFSLFSMALLLCSFLSPYLTLSAIIFLSPSLSLSPYLSLFVFNSLFFVG